MTGTSNRIRGRDPMALGVDGFSAKGAELRNSKHIQETNSYTQPKCRRIFKLPNLFLMQLISSIILKKQQLAFCGVSTYLKTSGSNYSLAATASGLKAQVASEIKKTRC